MDQVSVSRLHVFLSSPGDVSRERQLAREVLDQLESEDLYRDRLRLEVVAWDKPGADTPMPAQQEPQAAIEQWLKKPSQCDIVIVIFWSRMGTPLTANYPKPGGGVCRSGTEYEFLDAMKAAEETGKPKVLVYRCLKKPYISLDDPERDQKASQWDQVKLFFAEFQNPDGSLKHSYKSYNEPHEFRQVLERDIRKIIQRHIDIPSLEKTLTLEKPKVWDPTQSPFPGLQPFTPDKAPIFFGRDREIDQLVEMLGDDTHRFIAVVGASGSGKSSLVWAGLLPALANDAIPGSKDWIRLRFTPAEINDNPFTALATVFTPAMETPDLRIREVAEQLETKPEALNQYLQMAFADQPQWAELLLFIDQFEEFFTLVDPKYQPGFVDLLARMAKTPRMRIVVTLRSDFYHRGLDWPVLNRLLAKGHYSLLAPGAGALYEMITRPAQHAGLRFEDGLPNRIFEDTGTEPGALALMAFALRQLWTMSKGTDGLLTHGAYESFNGVQGAIGQQAEATFSSLTGEKNDLERTLSEVFRQLVEVDERGVSTLRRAPMDEIARGEGSAALVDNMTEARLLVTSGTAQHQPVVEVAHEAIFTHWSRLKEWIEVRKDDLRLLRQVRLAASEWEKEELQLDKQKHIWADERVKDVMDMMGRLGLGKDDFSETEQEFLGPIDPNSMPMELNDPTLSHQLRATIGRRLSLLGDPRPGVGMRPDGLPKIVWCEVLAGDITLDEIGEPFHVEPYSIAKYPITVCQYISFLEAYGGYKNPQWWKGLLFQVVTPNWQANTLNNHPAVNICWLEAVAFCRWLTVRLGYKVRLPTEWEWQQAATGGNPDNAYAWGDEWHQKLANSSESGLNQSTAVGIYPKGVSPVGALDMCGNVWEWCLNEYENPKRIKPSGDANRVVRGGCWFNFRYFTRPSFRHKYAPYYRDNCVGFRLIRLN